VVKKVGGPDPLYPPESYPLWIQKHFSGQIAYISPQVAHSLGLLVL
jgi:hypothetical protein